MKRLLIVVPYRDRAQQLRAFVAHLSAYFTRDKTDRDLPYRVLIVEQDAGAPFNRGAIKNVGFALGEGESDYVCFHDVDYLPTWADYSWSDQPTPLVWFGAERTPVAPGRSDRAVNNDPATYFGGAVLFPNAVFRRIDGYADDYWGWGYEDHDVRMRLALAGFAVARRRGTFLPLYHDNEGFRVQGGPSAIHVVNKVLFERLWTQPLPPHSGLSTLSFDVISRRNVELPADARAASWEMVKVHLNMTPSAD